MADKIKGITIEFRGETTKLDKALKSIRSESKDIDKELREVNKALKFNPNNVVLLSQKEQLLNDKIKASNDQLAKFRDAQKQLKSAGIDENTSEWRTLQREIIEAESKVKYFENSLDKLKDNSSVKSLGDKMDALGGKLKSVGSGMTSAGMGMSAGAAGAIVMGKQFVDAAETQLSMEDKLKEAYKSHVKGGEEAAKATMEYASALQASGVIGDEVTIAGAGVLANYTDNANVINKLLPAMDNLLVKQKGYNASESDAEATAKSLGKALAGNASAFTKLGISLSDEQKEQFKAMDETQRLSFILQEVQRQTGNMNEEFAKTDLGQLQQAKNTIGDVGEEIGKALLPAIADIAKWLSESLLPKVQELINFVTAHPVISKIVVGITAFMAVAGPVLMFIGSLISIVGTLIPILGGLEVATLAAAGPFIAIAAAIAAAVAIGIAIWKNWDTIKAKAIELGSALKGGFLQLWTWIKKCFTGIGKAMLSPFLTAWTLIKKIVSKIKSLFPFKVKLPHIGISPKGWKPSDLLKGSIPHLGLNWYKNGGMFSSPSVIGVGEAGTEAVVPLDKFWSKMDDMTASIVAAMQIGLASQGAGGNLHITVELGGTKVGETIVNLYDKTKKAVG